MIASTRSRRRAALAIPLVAFLLPYLVLVRPARQEARAAVREAGAAEQRLEEVRVGLAQMADPTEAGLLRERRRNRALRQDARALAGSLALHPEPEYRLPLDPNQDPLTLFRHRSQEELERLVTRARSRGIELRDWRLGFPRLPELEVVGEALLELEIEVQALDRAIDAGVRRITALQPWPCRCGAHDPAGTVAHREVCIQVEATPAALARWFHALQTRTPYLAVREVEVPAATGSTGSPLGELVGAEVVVAAYYPNDEEEP